MIEAAIKSTVLPAPAQFLGIQPGFGEVSPIELYVLLSPVGHHPIGSTVSRQTLERHGFNLFVDHRTQDSALVQDKIQTIP